MVVVSLEASLNTTMPPTKLTLTLNQTLTSAWSGAESAKAHCAQPNSIPEVCFAFLCSVKASARAVAASKFCLRSSEQLT